MTDPSPISFTTSNRDFPCAISLLSGKRTDIYRQLLSELEYHAEQLKLKFEPAHSMSDFDPSLIKIMKEKFPKAIHHGCLCRFCQSFYKQIESHGLGTAYLDDEDTRLVCRSTMALAHLPIQHMEEAFELLKVDSPVEMD